MKFWSKLISIIIVFTFLLIFMTNGSPRTSMSDGQTSQDAYYMCHQSVEAQLKNPDSASFESYSTAHVIETSDNNWEITAEVTSENSFGGRVTNTFFTTVEYRDDNWYGGRVVFLD